MKTLLKTAAAIALTAGAANAATIIDITPGDNRANMSQDAGQTFTTGVLGAESFLSEIGIFGDSNGTASSSVVTAQLWIDTDQDFGTWDPGALVATSTNSQAIAAADQLFTFTFSGEALSDNTVYVLSFTDGTNNHVAFRSDLTSGGGSLADGALFSSGAQPFGGAYDASIKVVTTTQAVPEPSSAALLGLGGLALILRRRK
ncbi:PEP-CTERM sorting domain-containing protein [Sulfuriroseicoccus oceanibius]|uniref:PEP-CTERM sorting domain-containing protein n=1 Tax=Sulfuriroseicoccus oceanibius TaxID=2707525 RepID=UPI001F2D4FCE|nr:PEP-CTERM sorting domain-containing protein [Sulfuriroseicoccus oceanibius]